MAADVYTSIKNFFDENFISYREVEHAPGASAEEYHNALGCRYEQQAKCLLIKVYGDMEYFVILTIPAQKRANLDLITSTLKARKVRMATKEELKEVTGCNFGELPPLGKIFNLSLIMDGDFLNESEIFLNAGRVDRSFIINPLELKRAENPLII